MSESKRKKFITGVVCMLMLCFCMAMTGCEGSPDAVQPEEQVSFEIALVTDDSLIMDGGHTEAIWNAITQYGATNGISHKYYKAVETTDKACRDAIKEAVAGGAGIVITDGYTFDNAVFDVQEKYPDVKFVLINSEPFEKKTGDIRIMENTAAVVFDSAQAGYLAGYAAVCDGYTQLGFMGENNDEATAKFGYGFAMGADKAAGDLELKITMRYEYCNNGEKTRDASKDAMEWYSKGTQVIFTCGYFTERSVIEAAEIEGGRVIGCITDKSGISDTVITSATQNLGQAVEDMLEAYKADKFPGGKVSEYSAANDGIALEITNSRFRELDLKTYEEMYEKLASGDIEVNIEGIEKVKQIRTENIVLNK